VGGILFNLNIDSEISEKLNRNNCLINNNSFCYRAKARLHEIMQEEREFTDSDRALLNPCGSISIATAMEFVKNPVKCCTKVQDRIQKLMAIVKTKRDDPKCKGRFCRCSVIFEV